MPPRSDQDLQPSALRFLMTLPVEQDDYFRSLKGSQGQFIPKLCPWWSKYEDEIARPFKRFESIALDVGCEVWRDVSSDRFSDAFDGSCSVVTVFAHWGEDELELSDGLFEVEHLLCRLPTDFSGIVDLTVCHPWPLVTGLKRRWPECLVKHSVSELRSALWWPIYAQLVRRISISQEPYLDAFLAVSSEFAE